MIFPVRSVEAVAGLHGSAFAETVYPREISAEVARTQLCPIVLDLPGRVNNEETTDPVQMDKSFRPVDRRVSLARANES